MRSQRRFENNAVWCERSEAALFDTGVRKGAFYVGGLLLPREVFWKRILAKSRSLRRCGCQCERVQQIMRRERPTMHWGDDVLLLYLAPFFKPHFPKCGDPMLGVKANRSALEYSSSKTDELKVEFSAEWLRIWRYERGIRLLVVTSELPIEFGLSDQCISIGTHTFFVPMSCTQYVCQYLRPLVF